MSRVARLFEPTITPVCLISGGDSGRIRGSRHEYANSLAVATQTPVDLTAVASGHVRACLDNITACPEVDLALT